MNRVRLLIVALLTTCLFFVGLGSATAHDNDKHSKKTAADIVYLHDTAYADWDKVAVKAVYKCWGDGWDIKTRVKLTQHDGARYSGRAKGLHCDGKKHEQWVHLWKDGHKKIHNGGALLQWKYEKNGRTLDYAEKWVKVVGAKGDGKRS
jgi:hypothetical protein